MGMNGTVVGVDDEVDVDAGTELVPWCGSPEVVVVPSELGALEQAAESRPTARKTGKRPQRVL